MTPGPAPRAENAEIMEDTESTETPATPAEDAVRAEPVLVVEDEDGLRLDRWFKRRYPGIAHGRLEKMLRTGQVRIDGHRAKAGDRVVANQRVRVPPGAQSPEAARQGGPLRPRVSAHEAADLKERLLYRDAHVIVIDKPAGLAVQGGTKTVMHLDGMLDVLSDGGERPRLVHRLDKDTSGVLLLARTSRAAASLAGAFRAGTVRKLYWAAVVGLPAIAQGRIDQPLAKCFSPSGERVGADDDGLPAVTDYRVVERAGRNAAWLALEPLTGRTHQIRAHCALLGTPILGDGKYGGAGAFLENEGLGARLHLHARILRFPNPGGGETTVSAPLPPHMRETWRFFGFSGHAEADAFIPREEPRRRNRTPRPPSHHHAPRSARVKA